MEVWASPRRQSTVVTLSSISAVSFPGSTRCGNINIFDAEHGQTPNSHSSRHRENRILRGGVGADPISNTGIYVTRNVEITMDVENDGSGNLKKGAWNEADIA